MVDLMIYYAPELLIATLTACFFGVIYLLAKKAKDFNTKRSWR